MIHMESGAIKSEWDDVEFHHPYFVRGEETLLGLIKRKVCFVLFRKSVLCPGKYLYYFIICNALYVCMLFMISLSRTSYHVLEFMTKSIHGAVDKREYLVIIRNIFANSI